MQNFDSAPNRDLHSMTYRPDIDGLRAIAVLLVLVFHFDLVPGGKSGFIGVDVFFVISGYLITSVVKKQLENGSFSIGTFYLNRIRRLAPALFAVLLLTLIAGLALLFPTDLLELSRQILFSQLYVANIYYWKSVSYFGLSASDVFLLHNWSLALEEQFYLLYPLSILLIYRYQKKHFWRFLCLGFCISFVLNVLLVYDKPEATFYLLPTRAWELLAGALIPFLSLRAGLHEITKELLGVIGVALILAAVLGHQDTIQFPGFFALLPVVGATCLILAGREEPSYVSRVLSLAPIVYIGRISYSLYLVHWPINVLSGSVFGEGYSLVLRWTMFFVCVVVAAFIYHGIEDPVRRRRSLRSDRSMKLGYFAGLAATLVVFLTVQLTHGLPNRYPENVLRIANFVNDKTVPLIECQFSGGTLENRKDFCHIGLSTQPPTWIVYGDSHTWAAHEIFENWLSQNGQSGLFIYLHSCPPVIGVHIKRDKGACFAFNNAVAKFLSNDTDIRKVILVSTWRQALEGRLSELPDVESSKKESMALFESRFATTLRRLRKMGKEIYVWEPLPGARGNVPIVLARAALTGDATDIRIRRDEYYSTYDYFFRALKDNNINVAKSFSPSAALCDAEFCSIVVDGSPVYFDNGHITKTLSPFWIKEIGKQWGH